MKLAPVALLIAACTAPAPPSPALPWVSGLAATASGDVATAAAARRLDSIVGMNAGGDYGAIALPTSFGTILASYQQGVAIVDGRDRLIARAPGFTVEGSADDLVAIAVGDAQLDAPVIVLAISRGGHRVSTTSIIVYQVARGRLDPLFEAPIEERDGDHTLAGTLAFVPHGLTYRSPGGALERWSFDPARRRYVRDRGLQGSARPMQEPWSC